MFVNRPLERSQENCQRKLSFPIVASMCDCATAVASTCFMTVALTFSSVSRLLHFVFTVLHATYVEIFTRFPALALNRRLALNFKTPKTTFLNCCWKMRRSP